MASDTRKPCIVCGELTWMVYPGGALCTRIHEDKLGQTSPDQRMAEYRNRTRALA